MDHCTASKADAKLCFTPWLINEVSIRHHEGLHWLNMADRTICIPWPRATKDTPLEDLGVIYCWHKHRKGLSYDQNRSPSTMKSAFRSLIRSRNELIKEDSINGKLYLQLKDDYDVSPCSAQLSEEQRDDGNGEFETSLDHQSCQYNVKRKWSDQSNTNSSFCSQEYQLNDSMMTDSSSSLTPSDNFISGPSYPIPYHNRALSSSSYELATAPSWAQDLLARERASTDLSCIAHVTVYNRDKVLCETKADLRLGLLIYSDTFEVDFDKLSEGECNVIYGIGSQVAKKLLVGEIQTNGDMELEEILPSFRRGILLFSDLNFNIMAIRQSKARTFVGYSNQGGAQQMKRSHTNLIFSYITYIEVAGNLLTQKHNNRKIYSSDHPTATTIVAIGQKWTMKRSIHDLPLYIQIIHERAQTFGKNNLQDEELALSENILLSASDSIDAQIKNNYLVTPDLMEAMQEEMREDDLSGLEAIIFDDLGII